MTAWPTRFYMISRGGIRLRDPDDLVESIPTLYQIDMDTQGCGSSHAHSQVNNTPSSRILDKPIMAAVSQSGFLSHVV